MAWNGAIAFYIPVFIFFIWVVGLTVPALQSVRREARAAEIPSKRGGLSWGGQPCGAE